MSAQFSQHGVPRRWNLLQRLTMREREVRDSLWLLGSIVFICIPLSIALPVWASVAFVVLVAWRTRITWLGKRLPPRWLLIALLLITGAAVFAQYHTIVGKDAGVTYIVLLLALKLLELRAKRDMFVVVFLCLFVMLTSLFDEQTILNALWLIVDVALLTGALIRASFVGSEPALKVKLRLAIQMTLLALPLMVVLFILFPRVSGPLWGLPADAYTGMTGLSDTMNPGAFDALAQSDELAFQVKFKGRVPPPASRYWRGPVLAYFDGRAWRPGLLLRDPPPPLELQPVESSEVEYTETIEPSNRPWLYLLDAPVATPQLSGQSVTVHYDLQVTTENPLHERTRFDARSAPDFVYGLNETPGRISSLQQVPRNSNPKMAAYALELRAAHPDPKDLVLAVLNQINHQQFYYTLTPPAYPGRDGVDQFFFGARRGFCEHYASAMAVFLRDAGIPARIVTGYLGGEINPVDGYLSVHQKDAHAWTEYWTATGGWVRVDPTAAIAPSRIDSALLPQTDPVQQPGGEFLASNLGFVRYMRANFDALGNAWTQFVIGYSNDEQATLFSRFGVPQVDWADLTIALAISFSLVLGVIAGQFILKRERPEPIVRLYLRLCRELAKTGKRRALSEGPRDYAARVTMTLSADARQVVLDAFAQYETLRYSSDATSNATALGEFKRRIARVARLSLKP